MGKRKENVCPGCSRHCTMENIRCKYGRNYFEKQREQAQKTKTDAKVKRCKWEKYVAPAGMLCKLLRVTTRIKKLLKRGDITEAQILSALTGEEREALGAALDKMDEKIKICPDDV